MKLTFFGATRRTTGSKYLLEINNRRLLIECGMYQGHRDKSIEYSTKLPFDPTTVHAMVLSHAHIDHSGVIPILCRDGFHGPIHSTDATADLCQFLLLDTAHIQEQDAIFVNKKRAKKGLPPIEPIYTQADATAYYRHALGPLRPAPKEGPGWMFAAGELAMTAHDLALWDESLIAQSLLKPDSYKQMFTEVKLKSGKGTHYGLGVGVVDRNGHRSIEHSGEVSGFVSDNVVLVDDGVAIAVLTNQDAIGAASSIARLAAPAVAGYPPTPEEQQAIAIYHGLQQGRIDRALLAPNLSDYFTPEALADFKSSLAPLGEPLSFRQAGDQLRGGMTFRSFQIVYPDLRLRLTTYTYPDGKLEQFLIASAE